ncbi:hypothetical protein LWI29_026817 [Acer saccharum]|uniref:Protein kinase domain-containing protein n=1 Tax=Acer saccharum TaxID=4024 RepID=A0AA39RJF6_ACESA|nr:hypothetical protein LWI29_026817 [Acer saccharum]
MPTHTYPSSCMRSLEVNQALNLEQQLLPHRLPHHSSSQQLQHLLLPQYRCHHSSAAALPYTSCPCHHNSPHDVLDEFEIQALQRKAMVNRGTITQKVWNYLSWPKSVAFGFTIGHRIKEIRERLDEIAADKAKFHLTDRVDNRNSHREREMAHSFVFESDVIGLRWKDDSRQDLNSSRIQLRSIIIQELPNLEELPQWLLHENTLEALGIRECPNFIAFPESLQNLQSLQHLFIWDCPKLISLPEGMHRLIAMRRLVIGGDCPALIERCKKDTGFGIGGPVLLIVALSIYITWRCIKGIYASPNSRYTSSDPSSKSDLEAASAYFGVPVFSYSELAEATNNFNHEKELGDGGFGTVYYGKLRDGREVAVKRLYEHNYRRVEQFMNEIKILTRLPHKNLVSHYGCTSRHSQGLLLVYEFIPNGTIADHLHGDRVNPCLLTWPIRMNIAIETASALAYLYASDIIHRDVKTNNILLDNNFCVKVADFGLSRLFPSDVTCKDSL